MSIIQQIRERYAAVSIVVIALSLVGFILMDALSSQTRIFGGRSTVVGEVNGTDIEITEFDTKLTDLENNYRAQQMEVNDEMRQQLIEMLWNNTVEETLLKSEYEKLDLRFTSVDMNEALYGKNPPPVLAQQFVDANNQYDANAARQFINTLKRKKADDPQRVFFEKNIIDFLISNRLRTKYVAMLAGSTFYPKWMSDKEITDNSSIASLNFVAIPYTSISDSSIKVTDEDINNYIRKHKAEFKQETSRVLNYVMFDASPTASDTLATLNSIKALQTAFETAADAQQFLNANNTAVPYFDGFVLQSKLQIPNAESVRQLPVGGTFGPYLDGANFVVARMLEKRNMPDSVKLRHILVSTRDPQSGAALLADSVAKNRADSIAGAVARGSDFKLLAAQLSGDSGSKDNGGEYTFGSQQFGSLAKPFAEFVFYNSPGSKRVVQTDFGYHYIEVLEHRKVEPAFKIAYLAKTIDPSDETINNASNAATQFASQSQDQTSFESNTKKQNHTPRVAEVKPTDFNIDGIGNARRLVKWAYENKVGKVSEPESFNNAYVVALLKEEKKEGLARAQDVRAFVEPTVRNEKKAQQISAKIGTSRSLTDIAKQFGAEIQKADSISFSAPFIPGIGSEPKVTGAAFDVVLKGKVSEPIAGTMAVYLIQPLNTGLIPSGDADYTSRRQQNEAMMKQNSSYRTVDALRRSAKVQDKRILFY
ncbi:MAG: hypothetical protein FJX94_00090 [Bacteroidetes bacterium]|nr:hypothetical protein [Bacteroidota bacterium]